MKYFFLAAAIFCSIKLHAQANTTLSNLTSPTSVNVNLLPGATNVINLGSGTKGWKNIYLTTDIFIKGQRFISAKGTQNVFMGKDAGKSVSGGYSLTAVGDSALYSNTTGFYNTAVGRAALFSNITGRNNTGLGYKTLYSNTTGISNEANGHSALFSNTTGNYNVGVGVASLYNNTDRNDLVAIGDSALFNNGIGVTSAIEGTENSALGSKSLYSNTKGFDNTGTGYKTLYNNTIGYYNTANGTLALYNNITGYHNVALGARTLYKNVGGYNNTALGDWTLNANTEGHDNTAIGLNALTFNTTGNYNVATGRTSLSFNTVGMGNTGCGYSAGSGNDNNSFCTFIGYQANQTVTTTDYTNSTALGNTSRITASNQVRIGNSAVTSIGGQVDWTTLSDGRFKKQVKENVPGLLFINKLKPVTYHLDVTEINDFLNEEQKINDGEEKNISIINETKLLKEEGIQEKEKILYTGFVAQDVEKAAKEIYYDFSGVDAPKNKDDYYGLRYAEFVVPLVKAVQELSKQNDDLQKQINELKAIVVSAQTHNQEVTLTSSFGVQASSLEQNIPNPFNHTTTINYSLPQQYSLAKMSITDKSGKILKEINISGHGKGSLTIDASTLSSGAYQYSLYVDGKLVNSKQMVLQNN